MPCTRISWHKPTFNSHNAVSSQEGRDSGSNCGIRNATVLKTVRWLSLVARRLRELSSRLCIGSGAVGSGSLRYFANHLYYLFLAETFGCPIDEVEVVRSFAVKTLLHPGGQEGDPPWWCLLPVILCWTRRPPGIRSSHYSVVSIVTTKNGESASRSTWCGWTCPSVVTRPYWTS